MRPLGRNARGSRLLFPQEKIEMNLKNFNVDLLTAKEASKLRAFISDYYHLRENDVYLISPEHFPVFVRYVRLEQIPMLVLEIIMKAAK